MDVYKGNTASHFQVNMRQPLELDDDWEVGLSELHFPCAWDNVREGSNRILMRWRFKDSSVDKKLYLIPKKVPRGYYPDTESLVAEINRIASNYAIGKLKGVVLEYDKVSRRVTVKTKGVLLTDLQGKDHKVNASIKLKRDIARLLGFPDDKLIPSNRETISPYVASPTGGFHQMYIYSDLIQPQPHPGGNIPLLRVVAVEHDREEKRYTSINFTQPYFMPISKSRINRIEFKIADATGKSVGFSHGNTVVTLLFRRKS